MRYTLIILMLIFTLPTHSQDITNKLGGSTASETYDVTDSADQVLIRVQGDGKVGIGTTTPNYLLDVNGTINVDANGTALRCQGDAAVYYNDNYFSWGSGGNFNVFWDQVGINTSAVNYHLEVNGTAGKVGGGSWSNSSDIRLKDITGEYEQGLEGILKLRPITYKYKKNNARELSSEDEYIGFVAQEVQEHFPEAVSEGKDGYLDFNMHSINIAVINAIQELAEENKVLKARIEELERK